MEEHAALRWSGSFAVLPSTATSNNLSGDKITLPQSALEQLLAAAPSSPVSGSTFTAFDPHNPYRSSAFNHGLSQSEQTQQLPHPLTFRLVSSINGNVVFAGIREFSAPDETIGLSPYLREALGVDEQGSKKEDGSSQEQAVNLTSDSAAVSTAMAQITVQATPVPKGTYVRLRPLEAGYNPDDWKSLLERHLRQNFTTLTKNAVLSVRGVQGETFQFLVDKLAPEGDGICVVDTDLEVDIEALNEEQARETMKQIMTKAQSDPTTGISNGGELDIWKDVTGNVSPGGYVDFALPSWNRSQTLEITLSGITEENSLDFFVTPRSSHQRAPPRDDTHVFGDFSTADRGTKSISISPTNVEMDGAESILISVHGYRHDKSPLASEPMSFTLRAKMSADAANGDNHHMDIDADEHDESEEQCKHCLQWVPKQTMVLHESFCGRNNMLCPHCQAVFKKGSLEWDAHWHCNHDSAKGNTTAGKLKHDHIFHQDRSCPSCEFSTNSLADLARHRTSVCPGKIILCRFCHLEVPQEGDPFNQSPEVVLSGLTAHELADGARTTECHLCDKIVRLRDMETHMKHHELDKVSKPKPLICRNINCGRTLHGVGSKGQIGAGTTQGQGPGNDIGLCSICFGPLYVSMHDPDGKALRRRIERRYLGQMMTGCGKSHCTNEWCKTGRANGGLEQKGTSASAVLPLVKPLVENVSTPDEHMHFCVDETNQKRRRMAEMMAAERVYDLEWCVAAAEAQNGNIDKMRDWLQAWAPRK